MNCSIVILFTFNFNCYLIFFSTVITSGDVHVISITDCFGFECINRNRMDQLIINSLNEQLQYHFNQRMFVWEMIEQVSLSTRIRCN